MYNILCLVMSHSYYGIHTDTVYRIVPHNLQMTNIVALGIEHDDSHLFLAYMTVNVAQMVHIHFWFSVITSEDLVKAPVTSSMKLHCL